MGLNNKGFTLVEILAAVTILSILSILTFTAFSKYGDWTRKKAYDTLAKSASTAAEQYVMDYPTATVPAADAAKPESYEKGIKLDTLVKRGYLDNVNDPSDNSEDCKGKVVIGHIKADEDDSRALDQYMYVVHECCSAYKARYVYTVEVVKEKNKKGEETETLKPVEKVSVKDVICE